MSYALNPLHTIRSRLRSAHVPPPPRRVTLREPRLVSRRGGSHPREDRLGPGGAQRPHRPTAHTRSPERAGRHTCSGARKPRSIDHDRSYEVPQPRRRDALPVHDGVADRDSPCDPRPAAVGARRGTGRPLAAALGSGLYWLDRVATASPSTQSISRVLAVLEPPHDHDEPAGAGRAVARRGRGPGSLRRGPVRDRGDDRWRCKRLVVPDQDHGVTVASGA